MKMGNNNLTFILILLFLSLILSGCALPSLPFLPGGGRAPEASFRTGTQGLVLTFLQNAPPREVIEGQDAQLKARIENRGATDVTNAKILFTAEDELFSTGESKSATFSLQGKSPDFPLGDQTIEGVTLKARENVLGQRERISTTVRAIACYQYETVLVAPVCIDTDIYSTRQIERVCSQRDHGFTSQGAPVAITRVETEMLYSSADDTVKPQFKIHIKNVGNGYVLKSENEEYKKACSADPITFDDLNYVRVSANLPDKELTCFPEEIKLRGQEDIVRCTFSANERGISKNTPSYTSPLHVKLEYGYTTAISREVTIKSSS